ncbi:RNA polymerase sigma-70 factor [Chitinophaga agrisoli]|uniref:RNA polymerase sigma-70 factor n=1 Tax=Chitinophaga agrisoli TaxID=2607653 RepID=A0A5B2VWB0_9BACT|nr:RNA polymerase sigma-70 factor [Chitinophaga agrisoli]KAA2242537.1 RNA polymerase sigma-70 factor [Chitinophaga agrisoli]
MHNLQGIKELYDSVCLKDDMTAYQQLFLVMETPLIAFIKALVGATEVAEELYSDLFVKIWARRKTLPATQYPRNYIYTMARNLALDYLKKERPLHSIEFHEIDPLTVQDQAPTPEEQVISKEMIRKIESAINVLPARCRLIFKMVKEDGFKYKEVAALLGISVNTVEVQMSIALKKVAASVKFKTLAG